MKKRLVTIMMAALLLAISGCGTKKETTFEGNTESVQNQEESTDGENEVKGNSNESNVLAGVYPGGEKLASISMGHFYDGKQQIMCNIQMPENYIFGALYTPDGMTDVGIDGVTGETDLKTALEKGLKEQTNAINIIHMASSDGTVVELRVIPVEETSLEDAKAYAASYQELGTEQHPAINYEDPNEYTTSEINLYYTLNDNFMLLIRYEGHLVQEIGKEQLAQNLYDLVEVIE